VSGGTSPEESAEREIVRRLVGSCLDDLEIARDRQVLVRRYFLDQDTETIAQEIGLSHREVRVVLCRARQRLYSAFARRRW
jgi:RNA polymerase sigma factor (sigma-70 family)